MNLDQSLIESHSASRQEIDEALEYQQAFGGRLESHLFRLGYVGEDKLVEALAAHLDCAGISLSGREISEDILSRLPSDLAWSWNALPVAFDSASCTLTMACEDPRQPELIDALSAACPGMSIELRVALGDILRSRLARYYRQPVVGPEEPDFEETTISVPTAVEERLSPEADRLDESGRSRILLYDGNEGGGTAMAQMLSHQNFTVDVVHSIEELIAEARGATHLALILTVSGGGDAAVSLLSGMTSNGLELSIRPTFLVLSQFDSAEVSRLLKAGLEDVFGSDNVLDLLLIKLGRLRERLSFERNRQQEIMQTLGTHGSLTDMNVIDLLQAMGPTGKTARINVSAHGQQLTLYLDRGRIVYAECDDLRGPEAVFCALGWRRGVWSVDPVSPEELPEPNNDLTNEAVLLDGCRRLDESGRVESHPKQTNDSPLAFFENLA